MFLGNNLKLERTSNVDVSIVHQMMCFRILGDDLMTKNKIYVDFDDLMTCLVEDFFFAVWNEKVFSSRFFNLREQVELS